MQQGAIECSQVMTSIPTSPSSLDIMKLSSYHSGSPTTTATTTTTTTNTFAPNICTPSASERIDRLCDPKDCMKLTPINLRCLASPIRQPSHSENDNYSAHQRFLLEDVYKENFTLISKQLERLLENLNVIFKTVGYSNSEIVSKEKLIFNTLSDSITKFFEEAENDMKSLTDDNKSSQEILNRILEIIHDPSGANSIPDLYVRNAILMTKSKTVPTSPRKSISLLSKQKLLKSAKKFVYDAYVPKLMVFLNNCIHLGTLFNTMKESISNLPNANIVSLIPNVEVSKRYLDGLKNCHDDPDLISNFIKDNSEELLFSDKFNDISNQMTQTIIQSAKVYKDEYNARLDSLVSMTGVIKDLLKELDVDMQSELDPEIHEALSLYSEIKNFKSSNKYLPVNYHIREQLQRLLSEYQLIYKDRKAKKEKLLVKCHRLWSKLKVPQAYIDSFTSQTSGLSLNTLKKISKELEKLEAMKKKIIKTLVNESWQRIEELWKIMQYDEQERSGFIYIFESMRDSASTLEDDEKLLDVCEKEINSLEQRLAVYLPVLDLIKEFKQLQADNLYLEESSKDSSRLLLRNSHKILLQEEKTRKKITRHFPRVIQELKEGLTKIDELFGKPVVVEGRKLIDLVIQQEGELLNKYPRSRLNLGKKSLGKLPPKKPSNKIEKQQVGHKQIRSNSKTLSTLVGYGNLTIHQTPLRNISGTEQQAKGLPNTRDTSSGTTAQRARFSSPPRSLKRLLPPKIISRNDQTRIPELKLKRSESSNLNSSPLLRSRPPSVSKQFIRPTRLFPISPSRINQRRSQIPMLSKAASTVSDSNEFCEKENIVDSTPKVDKNLRKGDIMNNSSPYREPNNSIYKISMSPDGKCTLNIRQENIESGLDDTSIIDDDNEKDFITWKNQQILKINEQSKEN